MKRNMRRIGKAALLALAIVESACVSTEYNPGGQDNPLHQLHIGQSYGDMVHVLGKPDHSAGHDLTAGETASLLAPIWGLVELVGDYHPSSLQVYTYDCCGTVSIDNRNYIRKIEAKGTAPASTE